MSREALEFALPLGRGVLFCEDDIDLSPDFGLFLARAIEMDSVTWFYTHEGPKTLTLTHGPVMASLILGGDVIKPGLYPLSTPRRGTQCVYIPQAALEFLPLTELHGGVPIDIALDRWVDRLLLRSLVALPNPVQHRHSRVARSVQDVGIKRSLSFDLRREDQWLA